MTIFAENERGTLIVLPNVTAALCGVYAIFHVHPRYQLRYLGGTTEEADIGIRAVDRTNVFSIIGTVQDVARNSL